MDVPFDLPVGAEDAVVSRDLPLSEERCARGPPGLEFLNSSTFDRSEIDKYEKWRMKGSPAQKGASILQSYKNGT